MLLVETARAMETRRPRTLPVRNSMPVEPRSPAPLLTPLFSASYAMTESTLAMACNSSAGWFDVGLASQLGIVSFVSLAPLPKPQRRAHKR